MKDKAKKLAKLPLTWLMGVIILFGLLAFSNGVPFVYADGYCYYHIARSVIDYGSFTAPEKPGYFDYKGHVITEHDGRYKTVCSPGSGLILTPGIAVSQAVSDTADIYNDYYAAFNGHNLLDGIMILITATAAGIATVILMYLTLRNLNYSKKLSAAATLLTYGSSFAIWYVMLLPTYTHTYELFAVTLTVFGYSRYRQQHKAKYTALMGFAGSLAFIIRPTAVVPAALLGIWLLLQRRYRHALTMLAATAPALLIWILYNLESYGSAFASGYNTIRGETFSFTEFHFFDVLFSPHHGWLVFSPIFVFAIAGLLLWYKKDKALSIVGLLSIAATALIFGFWPSWAGGASFGSRFMIVTAAVCLPGMAEAVKYSLRHKDRAIKRTLLATMALLFTWSILLTGMYRVTPVGQLNPSGYYTAFDMYGFHLNLLNEADSPGAYLNHLKNNLTGGNSLLGIAAGFSDYVYRIDTREYPLVKIRFISPPVARTEMPGQIEFLLYSKAGESGYQKGVITDTSRDLLLVCEQEICTTDDPAITLTEVPSPGRLSIYEYEGLHLEAHAISLYFKREANVVFKGTEVYVYPNETTYRNF